MAEKQDKAGCGMQIFAFLLLAGLILLGRVYIQI